MNESSAYAVRRDPIAVTGASGHIGGAVARAIVRAGNPVLAFSRTDPGIPGAGWVRWDVREPATNETRAVAARMVGVVHAASMYSPRASYAEHYAVNVEGTRNVVDAFEGARLVHLSTTGVYDPAAGHHQLAESAGPVPQARYSDAYAATSALSERLIRRLKPHSAVLRPNLVYGPGERYFLPAMRAMVQGGTLLLPGGGQQLITMTHVDILVRACIVALTQREAVGPFNIGDAEPYVLGDALREFFRRSGQDVTIKALPVGLSRMGLRMARGARIISRSHPLLARNVLDFITHERTYDLSRQRHVLGMETEQHLDASRVRLTG